MRRLAPILAIPAALAAAARADEGPIRLEERVPLAFILSTPTGDIANIRSSDVIRTVSDVVERRTNFFLQIGETNVVADCRGRIGCLVLQARGDYSRESLLSDDGGVIPYSEHLRGLRERRTPYAHYLLIVSNLTQQGEADRLSAVLVDTDVALELFHSARRTQGDWERETEAKINERAVLHGPSRAEVRSLDEAQVFVQALFDDRLSAIFAKSGNWEPYGSVEIELAMAGAQISLDGVAVGASRPGKTELLNVAPGRRKLSIEHIGFHPFVTELNVETRGRASVRASLLRAATPATDIARTAMLYGGGALVAVGGVIVALAAGRADGELSTACFNVPGKECRVSSQFVTGGYDAGAPVEVNPPGLLLAPLGYSLAAAGVTWALGSLLGDESSFPWIELIAGTVVGGGAYGLSLALDGSRP